MNKSNNDFQQRQITTIFHNPRQGSKTDGKAEKTPAQGDSGIKKKICDADFFSKASLAGLTNYVIRHISKYGNIMTSFL